MFANRRILDSHKTYCSWCEGCKDYKDYRHIPNCKNLENPDRMKKQIRCNICGHFRNKATMNRHMKRKHGIEGWKAKEHPECVSMVIYDNFLFTKCKICYFNYSLFTLLGRRAILSTFLLTKRPFYLILNYNFVYTKDKGNNNSFQYLMIGIFHFRKNTWHHSAANTS